VSNIQSQFIPATEITPTKSLTTLKFLNTLLYLRLTLHEVIPLPLTNYTIADGKVTFVVPNEWQLTVTISDEFGQWWFVDYKDQNGNEVGDAVKVRLRQVLEDSFERCKIDYELFPSGVTEEALRTMNKRAPLVEAYNILRTSLFESS
jgi:Mediator complex subunit MED14